MMPPKPSHHKSVLELHQKISQKIKARLNKRGEHVGDAELIYRLGLIKASLEISGPGFYPFHANSVLAVRGNNQVETDSLLASVINRLQVLSPIDETIIGMLVEEPRHRVAYFDRCKALLPTIRYAETSENVFLFPSSHAKQVLRVTKRPPIKRGIFLGRVLEKFEENYPEPVEVDEALVVELGGNSVYIGAPGSGKSMTAKLKTDRLLGTNKHWFGRLMDNTEAATLNSSQLRGWTKVVEDYHGKIVLARNFKSVAELELKLEEYTVQEQRLVLFISQDIHPEFDEAYLRWVQQDIQVNNPGIFVVDECANWFKHQDDPRGGLYVDHLLNQFTANSYMSVTTIQVLGAIRDSLAHKSTYRMLMGLAQAGIYVFYTPDSGSLELDLNINTKVYPRILPYIISRIDGLKSELTGPVDQPGLGLLYSPGKAWLFMVESDKDTLERYARKDPEGEEKYFGL